jgi:D-3-phosphoglycerate dehydrogenase
MTKPVVLLYEPIHPKAAELLEQHAEVRMAESLDEERLLQIVGEAEGIIIRANGKVSRRLMEAAPRLKVVARHGTGVEAIDRKAAAELGIAVVNTPAANVESVAEQCVAMMINLSKRILEGDRAIRLGEWEARYRLIGIEPYGKTLGVIGIGRIGYRVAEICNAGLHMSVIYYDAVQNEKAETRRVPSGWSWMICRRGQISSASICRWCQPRGHHQRRCPAQDETQRYLINSCARWWTRRR